LGPSAVRKGFPTGVFGKKGIEVGREAANPGCLIRRWKRDELDTKKRGEEKKGKKGLVDKPEAQL